MFKTFLIFGPNPNGMNTINENVADFENPPHSFNRILWLASILLIVGLLLNLGIQPIFLEEPRRALVAMEMAERGNWWIPYQLGEFYYNKPPVFNWIVLIFAKLFNDFSELAQRLPTVLSLIGIGLLIFFYGRRYVNTQLAWLSALLFTISGGILFFFATIGEIDLFYTLITLAGILPIFYYYQKGKFYQLFLWVYFFGAIGTLTKGLSSIIFIGFSLLAWFLYKKEFKRLFHLPHFVGVGIYIIIVGGYLLIYAQYNSLYEYLETLWTQSSERTVIDKGFAPLLGHIFQFPLDLIKDTLPGSLLLLFTIRKNFWKTILKNEFIVFSLLMLVANILIYWASPGAKQRYIYPLYPFFIIILVYCWQYRHELNNWRNKTFRIISGVMIGLLAIGSLALNFVPAFQFLNYLLPISIGAFITLSIIFYYFIKKPNFTLPILIIATAMCRILFDLTVLPQRAYDSEAQRDRVLAQEFYEIVGDKPLYIYADNRISFTSVYYLNRLRKETLKRNYFIIPGAYYFIEKDCLPLPPAVLMEFKYEKRDYVLVQLSN
ncbi:MAG: glycosyltransferase family 39 protein [Saprospiraceae bacterium]|nr:glycosyltransferase family 39 protein [Saprospiraceae bacterium]